MRMLIGLDRPDAGQVAVGGKPYRELCRPLREVGAMLETRSFHPGRSARAHLGMLAVSNGISARRVEEVLSLVGLEAAGRAGSGRGHVRHLLAGVWLARGIVLVDALLTRALLGPSRVSELERTRAIAVQDAATALRQVERDLHDGAQVRLAAVALNLGLAQEKADSDALRELLEAAQTQVSRALGDLRRIARGIHPPVLDSGLADALTSLAAASPIPAQVNADLPERPSQAIEAIAYFCAAELLANAIKHSSANKIKIIAAQRKEVLQVRVTDDGWGGAALSGGSGLQGLAQRASTVDGTLRVVSPPGGPTTVTVELPMRIRGGGT